MRTLQLHIQFQQHRQTGKLVIVDDTSKLSASHNRQIVQWLHDVAVQKPGVKLFFDIMESVPDVDLHTPTVYRPIRFQAHRMSAEIPFMDGHKEIWEVKPTSQTDLEVNKNKWRAAEEACKVRGWKFKVFTEQGIDKLAVEVRRQALDD